MIVFSLLDASELVYVVDDCMRKGVHAMCAKALSRKKAKSQICLLSACAGAIARC